MPQAIQTKYNGYNFRSRLEARFAVVLDTLKQEYLYEPEGYELEKGLRYLPDFWMKNRYWIEVKPFYPNSQEIRKAQLLAKQTKSKVYIIYGDISIPIIDLKAKERIKGFCAMRFLPNGEVKDLLIPKLLKGQLTFVVCPKKLKLQPEVEKAILRGQQSRFEFGETPKQENQWSITNFINKLIT